MTPVKFATLVRLYTNTNSTSFPDADILSYANVFKDDIAAEITKVNEDYFGMRFYRNLQAGVREYGLPEEMLNNIKRVEAKLDGTTQVVLKEFDLTSYSRPTDENDIESYFSNCYPMFDIFNRSLWLYNGTPIINVTDGLILFATMYPADMTDLTSIIDISSDPTTTSIGFPVQFHELLARRVSVAYKTSRDRPIPLSEKELLYDRDLKDKLSAISGMNLDRAVIGLVPRDDGQEY